MRKFIDEVVLLFLVMLFCVYWFVLRPPGRRVVDPHPRPRFA